MSLYWQIVEFCQGVIHCSVTQAPIKHSDGDLEVIERWKETLGGEAS
jgi:hypothetical protein